MGQHLLAKISPIRWVQIGFFVSALITWEMTAEAELFEAFYDYSRAHEDWDLDELALLVVNLAVALFLSVWLQARRSSAKCVPAKPNAHAPITLPATTR